MATPATTTPTANAVPKALGTGKLTAGWVDTAFVAAVATADVTEAVSTTVASLKTSGGFGVVLRSFLGTIGATFKGNVLAGVQDGTVAVVGQVGQRLSSTVATVAVAATTTTGNITTLALTAGDWGLSAFAVLRGGATGFTANSTLKLSIVAVSATNGVSGSTMVQQSVLALLANGLFTIAIPQISLNLSATTTYYLTVESTYAAGSPNVDATIIATRVR